MTLPLSPLFRESESCNCSRGNTYALRVYLCRIASKILGFSHGEVCYPAVDRLIPGQSFQVPDADALHPGCSTTASGPDPLLVEAVIENKPLQPDAPKKPAEKRPGWNWIHNFQPVGRSGLRVDLTGRTFGMLTVLEYAGPDKFGHARWTCQCQCGRETTALGINLTTGRTGSCRCAMGGRRGVKQRGWLTREKPPAPEVPFKSAPAPQPERKRREPLHPSDVAAIRAQKARGYSQGAIARRFEITQAAVSLILKGKLHKDVV